MVRCDALSLCENEDQENDLGSKASELGSKQEICGIELQVH